MPPGYRKSACVLLAAATASILSANTVLAGNLLERGGHGHTQQSPQGSATYTHPPHPVATAAPKHHYSPAPTSPPHRYVQPPVSSTPRPTATHTHSSSWPTTSPRPSSSPWPWPTSKPHDHYKPVPKSSPAPASAPKVSSAQTSLYNSQIAALQQQIAALEAQLGTVDQGQTSVVAAVQAAQQLLQQTQTQIAQAQSDLNAENAKLAPTTQRLTAALDKLRKDKQQLATMTIASYEVQDSGSPQIVPTPPTPEGLKSIESAATSDQKTANGLQSQVNKQLAPVNATMASLSALNQTQQTQLAAYQQQADALTGQAQAINSQIAADQAQIFALQSSEAGAQSASQGGWITRGGLAPFAFGSRFDAFPWGQCTWYVASLRNVTWSGDAWQWAHNAAVQGYSEGMLPKTGAIVVWGAGNGYSVYGHVAYVASVKGPSDFVVNEANYSGLGVVDQREVTTLRDVEAFIY
jgi:surface antigen